jgi:hypothetical protein
MALYLGSSEELKLILDGVVYRFNLFTSTPITNFIRLLSSDNYTLQDSNGLYLTVKEDE